MQRTDGFIIGNGRCYLVEGSEFELDRSAKTADQNRFPIPVHSIVCLNGPVYGFNHFAYGFTAELSYAMEGRRQSCAFVPGISQSIRYDGGTIVSEMEDERIRLVFTDSIEEDRDVIIRNIQVQSKTPLTVSDPRLIIRYQYDRRNLTYCDFDGSYMPMPKSVTGPLLYEDYVLCQAHQITFRIPAHKPMYDDWSCGYGKQLDYAFMKERFLTVCAQPEAQKLTDTSFEIPLTDSLSARVLFGFGLSREASFPLDLLSSADSRPREVDRPVITSDNPVITGLLERIDGLIRANTAENGGVLAQPVMYPMAYNRDIYGSFKFYCGMGNLPALKKILSFFYVCQTTYGLQNAYDTESCGYRPGPDFVPVPARHERAEVPSYFVLMARDYYRLSDDQDLMKQMYPQLVHNLECQKMTEYFTIGTEGDESYTNFERSVPLYSEEMTDSCFLYTAACDFVCELAALFHYEEDCKRYAFRAKRCREAIESRMWLPDKGHYLFSRSGDAVDDRPALDLLCHPLYFQYSDSHHEHSYRSFKAVVDQLTEPSLQIVPGFNLCAGGDIGYLLYNAASFQLPLAQRYFDAYPEFASSSGAFSEYYYYQDGAYHRRGGNLRPWESGINGYCLFHYLFGVQVNRQRHALRLAPHLPDGTNALGLENYPVGDGSLSMSVQRNEDGETIALTSDLKDTAIAFAAGCAAGRRLSISVNGKAVEASEFRFGEEAREYTVPVTLEAGRAQIRVFRH